MLAAILFVLRTGCPWKALDATGLGSGSTAHRRFQEWVRAGLFFRLWRVAAQRYDDGPAIGPEGLRARVGAVHLPLGPFLQSFLDAGLSIERFEELSDREYPYVVALGCRR